MQRENKTKQILLRVRPTFKRELQRVANATGKNVTETIEDAFATYCATKRVRDYIAKPTEPAPKEEG